MHDQVPDLLVGRSDLALRAWQGALVRPLEEHDRQNVVTADQREFELSS
jgi:hypothetical protein